VLKSIIIFSVAGSLFLVCVLPFTSKQICTATRKTIIWPLPPTVHPPHTITEPYSLTHLPMNSMWVIASTTCFLYLLPPWLPFRRGSGYFSNFSTTTPYTIAVTLHTHSPMKMKKTECSETLEFKLQMPENNQEESIWNLHSVFRQAVHKEQCGTM
jgi:hypothetical protein